MTYFEQHGRSIREVFVEFHENNPAIFNMFEHQALMAIAKGKEKISAKLIINFIRWKQFIETSDEDFKINDAFQSYYARLFAIKYPEHSDIFNYRKLRNEELGPFAKMDENGKVIFI